MEENNIHKDEKLNQVNLIENIKSKYILELIFNHLKRKITLKSLNITKKSKKNLI